jgi:hypothetical protein
MSKHTQTKHSAQFTLRATSTEKHFTSLHSPRKLCQLQQFTIWVSTRGNFLTILISAHHTSIISVAPTELNPQSVRVRSSITIGMMHLFTDFVNHDLRSKASIFENANFRGRIFGNGRTEFPIRSCHPPFFLVFSLTPLFHADGTKSPKSTIRS